MSLPEVDVDLLAGRVLLIRPHLDERAWRATPSEAKEQLAQRDQELTAARKINRELIARLNRDRTEPRPRA